MLFRKSHFLDGEFGMKIVVWATILLWSGSFVFAESAKFFIKKGDKYSTNRAYEEAVIYYEKALDIEPNNIIAHRKAGETLLLLGRYETAKRHWEVVTILDPMDSDAFYNLGKCETFLAKISYAKECYEKALGIDPENVKVCKAIGEIFVMEEKYLEAEEWFRKTIDLCREILDKNRTTDWEVLLGAYEGLGLILENGERFDEALKEYKEAEKYVGASSPLWWRYKVGKLLMLKKEYKEAIRHFEKILTARYPHPVFEIVERKDVYARDTCYLLGYAYMIAEVDREMASQKSRKAFKEFLEYLDLENEERQKLLDKLLDDAKEERNLRARLLDKEENWDLRLKLSYLLASMQRWWEAKKEVKEVLLMCPDNPEAHMTLGRVLSGLDSKAEAIKELEIAMELSEKQAKGEKTEAARRLLEEIRKGREE